MINNPIIQKFFKDFTSHRKKTTGQQFLTVPLNPTILNTGNTGETFHNNLESKTPSRANCRKIIQAAVFLQSSDCLTVKAVKASINVSNVSERVAHFFSMLNTGKIFTQNIYLLLQNIFSQAYLIWVPKLDVPKISIPLSKLTSNVSLPSDTY